MPETGAAAYRGQYTIDGSAQEKGSATRGRAAVAATGASQTAFRRSSDPDPHPSLMNAMHHAPCSPNNIHQT